jgi:hypothetical protein
MNYCGVGNNSHMNHYSFITVCTVLCSVGWFTTYENLNAPTRKICFHWVSVRLQPFNMMSLCMRPKSNNVQRLVNIKINMFTYNTAFATEIWVHSMC